MNQAKLYTLNLSALFCRCCCFTYPIVIGCCVFVVAVPQSRDAQDRCVLHRRGTGGQVLHLVKLRRQPSLRGLCVWTGMGGADGRLFWVFFCYLN